MRIQNHASMQTAILISKLSESIYTKASKMGKKNWKSLAFWCIQRNGKHFERKSFLDNGRYSAIRGMWGFQEKNCSSSHITEANTLKKREEYSEYWI